MALRTLQRESSQPGNQTLEFIPSEGEQFVRRREPSLVGVTESILETRYPGTVILSEVGAEDRTALRVPNSSISQPLSEGSNAPETASGQYQLFTEGKNHV